MSDSAVDVHFLSALSQDFYLVDADDCRRCGEPIPASFSGPMCETCCGPHGRFVAALASLSVSRACEAVGLSRTQVYRLASKDPHVAKAMKASAERSGAGVRRVVVGGSVCPTCGDTFSPLSEVGRRRAFCSARCKAVAAQRRWRQKAREAS